MANIPDYPAPDRALDGSEPLAGWQDGKQRAILLSQVAAFLAGVSGAAMGAATLSDRLAADADALAAGIAMAGAQAAAAIKNFLGSAVSPGGALPFQVNSVAGGAQGTGGTVGKYAGGVSGGPLGFQWSVVIGSDGKGTWVIDNPGISTSNAAPTLTLPTGTGLSGATAPTATVGTIPVNQQFFAPSTDGTQILAWGNSAGTLTSAPFGGTQLAWPVATLTLLGIVSSVLAASGDLTNSGASLSFPDSDGRIQLAIGGDGRATESPWFVASLAAQAQLDNTLAAIQRMTRHGLTLGYPDWLIIGITGQSNAAGNNNNPITLTQPFSNQKWISTGGGSLATQVEAVQETVATAMSSHLKDRILKEQRPGVTAWNPTIITFNFGAANTPLSGIQKGTTPWATGTAAVTGIMAAAAAAGKTAALGALVLLHGETDSNNGTTQAAYLNNNGSPSGSASGGIIGMKNDANTDYSAITHQTFRFPMFIIQMARGDNTINGSANTGPILAMLQAAETDPEMIIAHVGHAQRFIGDGLHYNAHDQRRNGEMAGEAIFRYYYLGRSPATVRPLTWTRVDTRTIDITFQVPVPPLQWDIDSIWPGDNGLGFSVYDLSGNPVALTSVRIMLSAAVPTVRITTAANIAAGYQVGYAMSLYTRNLTGGLGSGNRRGARGNLCDSDRTPSYYSDAFGNPYDLRNRCAEFLKTLA